MKTSNPFQYLCPALLVLVAFLAAGTPAYGQANIPGYPNDIGAYDPREVALLPRFCIYTAPFSERIPEGRNPAEIERLKAQMGSAWVGIWHYCWGLMKTNRAVLLARDRVTREWYLNSSISEFDYVIKIAPNDFILLPEILTKKGENLIHLGRGPLGVQEFVRAIELKPDYWPPYANLSDYYKGSGDRQKAREFLEKGLSLSPDAPALKRRLAELDITKNVRKPPPPADVK